MSSIMRARSGLTGGWVGSEIIRGAFLEPKVDGPSMLGIGRPDRHALPRITLVEIAPTTTRAPSRASGFVHRRNLAVPARPGQRQESNPFQTLSPQPREPP